MKNLFILLLVPLFLPISYVSGQGSSEVKFNKKDREKFDAARSAHKAKNLDEALKVYCKLLNKYEGESELELWTGLAYKEKGKNKLALGHLKRAEENNTNPLLYSTIGEVYRVEKDYVNARAYYQKYLDQAEQSNSGYQKVQRLYDETNFAAEQIADPVAFNPKPLSNKINTLTSEYLPQFTADHGTLYFTRRIRQQEDIFYATKTEDGYSKPQPLSEVNSDEYNEGAHTISADGNTFIFTHEDDKYGVGGHDLYIMEKKGTAWGKPRIMSKKINTVNWESQPSLSGDGNILFFSSNRDGSLGGKDIWYSVKGKDGFWGTPRNAGDIINTKKDESSPFLHPDLKTLYFRSDGHIGMGSFDIFVARREDGKGWSSVQNLGYPINTEGQEGALTVSLDGTKAYFATDFDGEMVNDHLDIYEFDLPEKLRPQPCTYVKIKTIDDVTKEALISKLEIIDISTGTRVTQKTSDSEGNILIALPLKRQMMINVVADGYVFHSDHIMMDQVSHGLNPYEKIIPLTAIPKEPSKQSFVLNNIFFESGTAELQDISMNEINRLVDIVKESAHLRIKIIGHTDDVGTEADNLTLSKQRAQSVKNAMVNLGISSSKISTDGKGESQPISDNNTEEGRLMNRRTEFVLY